jgi:hypothetical protein
MVLLRRAAFTVEAEVAKLPPAEAGRAEAGVVLDAFLEPLVTFPAWTIGLAAVVALIAVVTGPYPWVVAVRHRVAELGRHLGSAATERTHDDETIVWVTGHRDELLLAGAGLGLLALWVFDLSWIGPALLAALVGSFELLVSRIAKEGEPAPTDHS